MLFLAPPPFGPAFGPCNRCRHRSPIYTPQAARYFSFTALSAAIKSAPCSIIPQQASEHWLPWPSVPIAWNLQRWALMLVLSNGPTNQHWLSKSIVAISAPATICPSARESHCRSSARAMFRRLVINPYAMEAAGEGF